MLVPVHAGDCSSPSHAYLYPLPILSVFADAAARQWYLAAMYKPCRGNNLTPAPSRCKEVQKIRQLIWRLPNFYQRQISFITGCILVLASPAPARETLKMRASSSRRCITYPAQNKHATETEWREMMLSPILRRGSPRLIQQRRSSSPFNTINKVKFWLWRHLVGRPQSVENGLID